MSRLHRIAAFALLALAPLAVAQGTMTFSWSVGDTGNNDGTLQPDEHALFTLWASMDPGEVGYAGSIFDILGAGNWDTGTVVAAENLVDILGTGPGELQGNNDILAIESFQLPPFFNAQFDAGNPVELYRIEWAPTDYGFRWIEISTANHQNASVYTDNFGTSVEYDTVINSGAIYVIPAPAGAAVVGMGLLGVRRRR